MSLFLSKKKRASAASKVNAYVGQRVSDPNAPYAWEFLDSAGSKLGIAVATDDADTVASLQATVRMTGLYRAAMIADPKQDGAAPWEAVLAAAESRNGGVSGSAGGSGTPIVTDSRSQFYVHAASSAIAALQPREGLDLQHVIHTASQAGDLTPIDIKACIAALRTKRGAAALELASSADPPTACQMFGEAAAWDSSLAENNFNGNPLYASLCHTHSAEIQSHRESAEKTVANELETLVSK